MGISRNGTIDRDRTEELKLARDDNIVDDCAREARGIQTIQIKYSQPLLPRIKSFVIVQITKLETFI